jgi:hypothetical protein
MVSLFHILTMAPVVPKDRWWENTALNIIKIFVEAQTETYAFLIAGKRPTEPLCYLLSIVQEAGLPEGPSENAPIVGANSPSIQQAATSSLDAVVLRDRSCLVAQRLSIPGANSPCVQ